ncbi:hypothetical protein D3N24_21540 [Vibrio vulnificus]|uniref:Phage abortive infection protein n=2 Tax=Vibrio vulnificus TaxID=672 RepID=A0A6S4Q791_VIBVL|nr:hypothetical protein [Vibrio vulnificus]ASJ38489.1 hypothetical protein VVCECT4999_07230 [Vibrio vulnificus]EGR0059300.1 hypothetical protein [Vibrio vulnificus]EGR1869983.1 hypothetical protein [Vibrio vulnificus]EJV9314219.1 hypothetical protein [Vibrio vulnificus]ELS3451498.1 hypothetical protein [Vibrio vulnificus]
MTAKLLFFCVLFCLILALAPFLQLPVLDTNLEFIGAYGAYLSGTLSTCIAFFAYLGVMKTLEMQRRQLEKMSKETIVLEIERCLERQDELLMQSLFNQEIKFTLSEVEYDLYKIMTMPFFEAYYQNVVKPKSYYTDSNLDGRTFNEVMVFSVLGIASLNLTRMTEYLREHRKITTKSNAVIAFYCNKHQILAKRLHVLGYLDSDTYELWVKKT